MMRLPSLLFVVCSLLSAVVTSSQCSNWEEHKAAFDAAKVAWTSPTCYEFVYTKQSIGSPSVGETIKVRNGVPVLGSTSIEQIFDLIEQECFANCPEAGAHECINRYAGVDGYPIDISIDKSAFSAGEEIRFKVSGFTVVDCSPETQVVAGEGSAKSSAERSSSLHHLMVGLGFVGIMLSL